MDEVDRLLREQEGVVSRRQLLEAGLAEVSIARLLRRRELFVLHPGVYVEHNGPLTWIQRAWAAVLHAAPAALYVESARRAAEGPGRRGGDEDVVHVAVAWPRRVGHLPGVRVHRVRALDPRVQWQLRPPRVHYDETVLDLAARAGHDVDAVAVLAEACGGRRTTAARLAARLRKRTRFARRGWLLAVLDDVARGTCSVLEHGYLDRVARPHGLPLGQLQAPRLTGAGFVVRDVEHAGLGLAVELDSALFHTSPESRDRDLDRDLVAAAEGDLRTVRLGWSQVFRDSCRTAQLLAVVMQRLGWPGTPTSCPSCRTRRGT